MILLVLRDRTVTSEKRKKVFCSLFNFILIIVDFCRFQYGCIVSSSADGAVKVWSHRGVEITTLQGHSQKVNGCDLLVKVSQPKQPGP